MHTAAAIIEFGLSHPGTGVFEPVDVGMSPPDKSLLASFHLDLILTNHLDYPPPQLEKL